MENNPFAPPNILDAKRILAIQPHYDDNDIFAGGTLATLAERGAELHYLTVTDDLVGVVDASWSKEEATARLRDDQRRAGEIVGVRGQCWLGYPDAGKYDYFDVRRDIIQHIRLVRPDFILTVDPWMPYEAHNDHILTGRTTAEAAILFGLTRLPTDPEIDASYDADPFDLVGVGFYATANPNVIFDISAVQEKKHRAMSQYHAQFSDGDMASHLQFLAYQEQKYARDKPFAAGEPLKVLRTLHLHGFQEAVYT